METNSHQLEQLERDFDEEIKALISILAELCVHELLKHDNNTEMENEK